ncbi:MAG: ribosomal-processing cysteine protease Prp [Lachnospiraceae bacterium]|nr:ribosomal-processing cysteine protease Prp [Lachnospiraceae bacterium]
MIRATFFKKGGRYTGFKARGHAGYGEEGTDIICAAVSVLTINTANSLELLADEKLAEQETDGFVSFRFENGISEKGMLLMDSLHLGLRDIAEGEGKGYIKVNIEEE